MVATFENVGGLVDQVQQRWPLFIITALLPAVIALAPKMLRLFHLWNIPQGGQGKKSLEERRQEYLSNARTVYTNGYRAFKDGVFRITTSRKSPVIVVDPEFLPFLKSVPDSVLSMAAAVDETMESKYTRIDTVVPIVPHTIKTALTPALTRLSHVIHQETREVLAQELPSSTTAWEVIDVHHALLRIVAMVSGRVFIGPELCRDERYLDAAINYTMDVMTAQRAVQQMRPWLRPLMANRLPQVKRLEQRTEEAVAFLDPIIESRKRAQAEDPMAEKPDDMLQWLTDAQSKFSDPASQNLARAQLGLGFAAIHTTALTATNAFYDLVALPDFVPELRAEVQEAMDKNGGVLTASALQSMKKMDSFLKEVLRVSPASMASFQRKVLSQLVLPNGQVIPPGVTIEVPAVAVNSDDSVFPDAHRFDPLRFYKLRQQAADDAASGSTKNNDKSKSAAELTAQNQFVSVSQRSLTFGFGRHACPGRFFAANEIKMILACAILEYEFGVPAATGQDQETEGKVQEKEQQPGKPQRYPNIEFAHMCIPDFSRKILCRRLSNDMDS